MLIAPARLGTPLRHLQRYYTTITNSDEYHQHTRTYRWVSLLCPSLWNVMFDTDQVATVVNWIDGYSSSWFPAPIAAAKHDASCIPSTNQAQNHYLNRRMNYKRLWCSRIIALAFPTVNLDVLRFSTYVLYHEIIRRSYIRLLIGLIQKNPKSVSPTKLPYTYHTSPLRFNG